MLTSDLSVLSRVVSCAAAVEPEFGEVAAELGRNLATRLQDASGAIRLVFTASDADGFVAPLLDELIKAGYGARVKLCCAWNAPVRFGEWPLSPIQRVYREPSAEDVSTIILAQSSLVEDAAMDRPVLFGRTTARTNLTHVWPEPTAARFYVATAFAGAETFDGLLGDFPVEARASFELLTPENQLFLENRIETPGFFSALPALVKARRAYLASARQT
jgi:hypothetical protein